MAVNDEQDTPVPTHGTWNDRSAIEEHRRMTPEQRIRKAIELSRAALRFAAAPRVDAR